MERTLKITGWILIVASGLFFFETAFEMYFLTPLQGPQMLFFSLAHIAPITLPILIMSGLAFICLMVFASLLQVSRFNSWSGARSSYRKAMLIVLCVQIIHVSLLVTYEHWAIALFANRGI